MKLDSNKFNGGRGYHGSLAQVARAREAEKHASVHDPEVASCSMT